MSASLLHKTLKLGEENKASKKKNKKLKKGKVQYYKWRTNAEYVDVTKGGQIDDNILKNIEKLDQLDAPVSLEVSDKVFSRHFKIDTSSKQNTTKEEKTVFTDKDFEEFEKEYFAS